MSVIRKSVDGSETFLFFFGKGTIFSNFTPANFTVNGIKFNCTEQYFHYKKAEYFGDTEMREKILLETAPGKQLALGGQVKNFDAERWNDVCRQFMKEAVSAKFQQNQDMKVELLKTNCYVLVEANPRDCKWGIGLGKNDEQAIDRSKWRGTNWLGEILMEVRKELSEKERTAF